MRKEGKGLNFTIIVLSILIIGILALVIYFMFIKSDKVDENSIGKIYIVRDGVSKLEKVPNNIVGKYVNNEFDEDYFILNSDGTAEATWYSGCSSDCGDVKDYFEKNELTFKLTYNDDNSVTLELQPLDKIYEGRFKPYIGKKVNNVYYFEVTEPTPVSNPGETKYIKK